MTVYYGGEDDVTRSIARKLSIYVSSGLDMKIKLEDVGIRERGAAVRKKLPQIVKLGALSPVVFVFDSDGECVVELLRNSCPNGWDNGYASLNVAIDEGESWLLADKEGFSDFFGINENEIIYPAGIMEVSYPYKTSLYIMRELVPKSRRKDVLENMSCNKSGKKPATYNILWKIFINEKWDVGRAKRQSESLSRAVERIKNNILTYYSESVSAP